MTEAEYVEAICTHFEAAWESLHPSDPEDPDHVPLAFDNEVFNSSPCWVRVSVQTTVRQQATAGPTGGRRFDSRGVILVQLFGDVDQGAAALSALADDVRTVLESRRIGSPPDVITYAGSSRPAPTDGRWHMRIVSVPFVVEETR